MDQSDSKSEVNFIKMLESDIKAEDINYDIASSWEVANGKSIFDAFVVCNDVLKGEKSDINSIVSVGSCIQLVKNSTNDHLEIKFRAAASFHLRKIYIVSEARLIEIYGKYEEYLSTCHGEFFDEWEGMSVYIAENEILHPTSECLLKFAKLKKTEIWLYGIKVILEKVESPVSSSINFQNVNKILKDSGHHLTDKAEKCKKFLQLYGAFFDSTKSNLKGPDAQILKKMFETQYLSQQNPLSEKAKIVSKCVADMLPGFAASVKEKNGVSDINGCSPCNQNGNTFKEEGSVKLTNIAESLKNYINQQFVEQERRLAIKVEERLKELERKQNEKLDLIIQQLQELQTRLKVT